MTPSSDAAVRDIIETLDRGWRGLLAWTQDKDDTLGVPDNLLVVEYLQQASKEIQSFRAQLAEKEKELDGWKNQAASWQEAAIAQTQEVLDLTSQLEAIRKQTGWKDIKTAPLDGTKFYVRQIQPARYLPYKPNSEQARGGTKGRWQLMNEYGGWDNYELIASEWHPHPLPTTAEEESK